jgi:hypothetical protein
MKVKDIIKTSATLLAKDNVVRYLATENSEVDTNTLREVNVFTTLLNCLVSELAGTYVPMKKTEEIGEKNEILFKDLSENAIRIIDVLDKDKNSISFAQYTDKIKTTSLIHYVVYEYIPTQFGLNDSLSYTSKDVSKIVLAYGLCAEYCITEARYDEAMVFHEKYIEGIKSRNKTKNGKVVARVWA